LAVAQHPWIAHKLAALQGEKWLFNLLYFRADSGRARKIRQLSFRITDLCNLRCHTCGQWGDRGFLHGQNLRDLKLNEVSRERYREVLDDLVAHGHRPFVYLWGGEPMLYEGSVVFGVGGQGPRAPSPSPKPPAPTPYRGLGGEFSSCPAQVVFLLQDLKFGGTQRQALELARRLNPAHFRPEVWLLADPEQCRAYGRAGRRRVVQHFSLEAMVSRHEEVWRSLLNNI
jgi:hypothetical protein